MNDLEKQVSLLKRQLESETLLRIDLENKNKTLREEIQFNQNVYETVNRNSNRNFCTLNSSDFRKSYKLKNNNVLKVIMMIIYDSNMTHDFYKNYNKFEHKMNMKCKCYAMKLLYNTRKKYR